MAVRESLTKDDSSGVLVVQDSKQDLAVPLLSPGSHMAAKMYGHSFNSKKVSQGPTFFNLRLMCVCVGRAIFRHIEFSRGRNDTGDHWLLDDLRTAQEDKDDLDQHQQSQPRIRTDGGMDFTYNLKEQLKVTINPENTKKEKKTSERAPTETTVEANEKTTNDNDDNYYTQQFEDPEGNTKLPTTMRKKKTHDSYQESWEESEDEQYSEINDDYNDEIGHVDERDDDVEDSDDHLDEFRDNDIDELDAEISLKETKQIERIRMEETFKQTM